eukprot:TRINITY_DN12670_c0_g1_i2.p2 TRINITY_DN12670_c0_g1~~TRINITY_DN12670_c0_g1_i2.p2  ORF type:complete len:203 (-),score=12.34 TRINITY_DN12670_c0_g1_i2:146-754(-)
MFQSKIWQGDKWCRQSIYSCAVIKVTGIRMVLLVKREIRINQWGTIEAVRTIIHYNVTLKKYRLSQKPHREFIYRLPRFQQRHKPIVTQTSLSLKNLQAITTRGIQYSGYIGNDAIGYSIVQFGQVQQTDKRRTARKNTVYRRYTFHRYITTQHNRHKQTYQQWNKFQNAHSLTLIKLFMDETNQLTTAKMEKQQTKRKNKQ